jgi:hypothetical protein
MSAPVFPLVPPTPAPLRKAVTLALTLEADPDNPVVGDLHLDRGQIHFWHGATSTIQKIGTRSRFFQGEWFLDVNEGIPFYSEIFDMKGRKKARVLSIFRAMLLSCPTVVRVISLDLAINGRTRTGTVTYEVQVDGVAEPVSSSFTPFYFPERVA